MEIFINLLFQPFSQDILMPRPFLGYPHSRRIRGFGYRNYYSSGSSYSNGKKEWFFECEYGISRFKCWWHLRCYTFCQQHPPRTSMSNIVDVLTCIVMICEPLKAFQFKVGVYVVTWNSSWTRSRSKKYK